MQKLEITEKILRSNVRIFSNFVSQWMDKEGLKDADKIIKTWNAELKRRELKRRGLKEEKYVLGKK